MKRIHERMIVLCSLTEAKYYRNTRITRRDERRVAVFFFYANACKKRIKSHFLRDEATQEFAI